MEKEKTRQIILENIYNAIRGQKRIRGFEEFIDQVCEDGLTLTFKEPEALDAGDREIRIWDNEEWGFSIGYPKGRYMHSVVVACNPYSIDAHEIGIDDYVEDLFNITDEEAFLLKTIGIDASLLNVREWFSKAESGELDLSIQ